MFLKLKSHLIGSENKLAFYVFHNIYNPFKTWHTIKGMPYIQQGREEVYLVWLITRKSWVQIPLLPFTSRQSGVAFFNNIVFLLYILHNKVFFLPSAKHYIHCAKYTKNLHISQLTDDWYQNINILDKGNGRINHIQQ